MNNAHSIINQLIQLQELVSAKMHKKVSMPNARLEELEKSIQALSADLTPAVKTHINRLLQKNPEAVVPVVNGNCAGCGMSLTKSLIQSVVKAEQLMRCNNCTRFLYDPTEVVVRDRVTRQMNEVRKTGIDRYSSPELMMVPLKWEHTGGGAGRVVQSDGGKCLCEGSEAVVGFGATAGGDCEYGGG